MGELLLCKEPIAAMPYYLERISVNVYSLEELCFCFLNHAYLIERDFMSEDFCTWVGREIGRNKLSEKLSSIRSTNGKLSDFVREIMEETGYLSRNEEQFVLSTIAEMEEKSDFECSKIRADRMMENGRYINSIYEYKRLLSDGEADREDPVIVGNIWHNLGTAFARLFLFSEAKDCYEQAYKRNRDDASRKELLLCYRMQRDESGFIQTALSLGLSDNDLQGLRNEAALAGKGELSAILSQKLDRIACYSGDDARRRKLKELGEIILNWKEEYRRICGGKYDI